MRAGPHQTNTSITPDKYHSLARHGLPIAEQAKDGVEWQTAFVHLKDFWEVGKEAGFIGYRVLPEEVFTKRLEEKMGEMFVKE